MQPLIFDSILNWGFGGDLQGLASVFLAVVQALSLKRIRSCRVPSLPSQVKVIFTAVPDFTASGLFILLWQTLFCAQDFFTCHKLSRRGSALQTAIWMKCVFSKAFCVFVFAPLQMQFHLFFLFTVSLSLRKERERNTCLCWEVTQSNEQFLCQDLRCLEVHTL